MDYTHMEAWAQFGRETFHTIALPVLGCLTVMAGVIAILILIFFVGQRIFNVKDQTTKQTEQQLEQQYAAVQLIQSEVSARVRVSDLFRWVPDIITGKFEEPKWWSFQVRRGGSWRAYSRGLVYVFRHGETIDVRIVTSRSASHGEVVTWTSDPSGTVPEQPLSFRDAITLRLTSDGDHERQFHLNASFEYEGEPMVGTLALEVRPRELKLYPPTLAFTQGEITERTPKRVMVYDGDNPLKSSEVREETRWGGSTDYVGFQMRAATQAQIILKAKPVRPDQKVTALVKLRDGKDYPLEASVVFLEGGKGKIEGEEDQPGRGTGWRLALKGGETILNKNRGDRFCIEVEVRGTLPPGRYPTITWTTNGNRNILTDTTKTTTDAGPYRYCGEVSRNLPTKEQGDRVTITCNAAIEGFRSSSVSVTIIVPTRVVEVATPVAATPTEPHPLPPPRETITCSGYNLNYAKISQKVREVCGGSEFLSPGGTRIYVSSFGAERETGKATNENLCQVLQDIETGRWQPRCPR